MSNILAAFYNSTYTDINLVKYDLGGSTSSTPIKQGERFKPDQQYNIPDYEAGNPDFASSHIEIQDNNNNVLYSFWDDPASSWNLYYCSGNTAPAEPTLMTGGAINGDGVNVSIVLTGTPDTAPTALELTAYQTEPPVTYYLDVAYNSDDIPADPKEPIDLQWGFVLPNPGDISPAIPPRLKHKKGSQEPLHLKPGDIFWVRVFDKANCNPVGTAPPVPNKVRVVFRDPNEKGPNKQKTPFNQKNPYETDPSKWGEEWGKPSGWIPWSAPSASEGVNQQGWAFGDQIGVVQPNTGGKYRFTVEVDLPEKKARHRVDPEVDIEGVG